MILSLLQINILTSACVAATDIPRAAPQPRRGVPVHGRPAAPLQLPADRVVALLGLVRRRLHAEKVRVHRRTQLYVIVLATLSPN